MLSLRLSLGVFALAVAGCSAQLAAASTASANPAVSSTDASGSTVALAPGVWPEIVTENKPWVRWWWPGNAVDQPNLTHQLEQFATAGVGGVEITPVYGAQGSESRYLNYLSPEWVGMLQHVSRETQRLGLGLDMATGTGWPFGGPQIDRAHSLEKIALQNGKLVGVPSGMKVKRAAPGGEGLVLDPFSTEALETYVARFDQAFAALPKGIIRSQFHDSFEYFDAGWTPRFAEVFKAMHGYDVQDHAAELMGKKPTDPDTLARLKCDFRDTLARMHLDFLHAWGTWAHSHGSLIRNQSHGAPGNLLDLYANADIAETEVFGSTPFPIPGLRRNSEDVRHDQDLPESLVIRMASSAGHVVGHPLTSSETCTWLRDNWKVALAYAKPEIDRLFVDGINHIFLHGAVYSPQDAAWPGWLFYASTQFNPSNPWWRDLGALTGYVARVQSVLQRGKPDNDILLYWPIEDVWDNPKGLAIQLTVHNVSWLTEHPFGKVARALLDRGYSLDYISDAQLGQTKADGHQLATAGGRYKLLVVPVTRRMPVETLRQIVHLAQSGAPVYFMAMPEDVPGFGRLAERRAEFQQLQAAVRSLTTDKRYAVYGAGAASAAGKLPDETVLATLGIVREPVTDTGLSFIRRASLTGHDYFFTNLTGRAFDGWLALGTDASTAVILDPLSGAAGSAALRRGEGSEVQIYLQIAPGESFLVRTDLPLDGKSGLTAWAYRAASGQPEAVTGKWQVSFVQGGPALPAAFETRELKSWTDLGGEEATRFAGTARYRLEFDAPVMTADDWLLDLGEVRESARVRLNGHEVATSWSLPFVLRVGRFLQPGRNVLELEITNLAANRIRDLDRRGVKWKIMHEINFVNINYQPFDASQWAITPAGLLGPVTLTPLRAVTP